MMKRCLLLCFVLLLGAALLNDRLKAENDQRNRVVAVLTYHHIDPSESAYTISPERFRRDLLAIRAHHYNVITVEDFIAHQQNGKKLPPHPVVLTFDDGYESFYRYAYPELKKWGMPATVFLIVSYVDRDPNFLKWSEVQAMKRDGFSFYSHTYNSHRLQPNGSKMDVWPLTNPIWLQQENRLETDAEYEVRVKADLAEADRMLRDKVGNRLSLLCFPGGIFNDRVLKLGDQAGIQYYFTSREGFNKGFGRLFNRINVGSPYIDDKALAHKLDRSVTMTDKLKYVYERFMHHGSKKLPSA